MSLTAQFYAGDTDKLWKTYVGSGSHTGTPVNGDEVAVWQDEATPSSRNVILSWPSASSQSPNWRSPGSMLLPCLEWSNLDVLNSYTNTGATVLWSSLVSVGAKTVIVAIRPTASATNNANIYDNSAIFSDTSSYLGLHMKTSGGVHSLYGYNWDGNADATAGVTVSLNTDYVVMYRHGSGTLTLSVLSGAGGATRTDQSVATGNTSVLDRQMRVGCSWTTHYWSGCIGEMYFDNTDLGSTNTPLSNIVGRWLPSASSSISPIANHYQRMMAG